MGDRLKGHVTSGGHPFLVVLEKDGTDQALDGCLVCDLNTRSVRADDIYAPLDLLVKTSQRIRGVRLGAELLGKGHEGQNVGLGNIH